VTQSVSQVNGTISVVRSPAVTAIGSIRLIAG